MYIKYTLGNMTLLKVFKIIDEKNTDYSKYIDLLFDLGKFIFPQTKPLVDGYGLVKKAIGLIPKKKKSYLKYSGKEKKAEAAINALVYAAVFDAWDTYANNVNIVMDDDVANVIINHARKDFVQYGEVEEPYGFIDLDIGTKAFDDNLTKFYACVKKHLDAYYNDSKKHDDEQLEFILGRFEEYALRAFYADFNALYGETDSFRRYADLHAQYRLNLSLEEIAEWQNNSVGNEMTQRARDGFAWLRRQYIDRTYRHVLNTETLPTNGELFVEPHFETLTYTSSMDLKDASLWSQQSDCSLREEVLNANGKPVVLIGDPGAGKTLLPYMWERRRRVDPTKMLIIDLSKASGDTILDQINDQLEKEMAVCTWKDILHDNSVYPVLLVFDGLDEMIRKTDISTYDYLSKMVHFQATVNRTREVHILVTCRKAIIEDQTLIDIPNGSKLIRLCDLDEIAIRSLLAKWNLAKPEKKLDYDELEDLELDHLLGNPLLLILLASYATESDKELEWMSKVQLYNRILEKFVEWDLQKQDLNSIGEKIKELKMPKKNIIDWMKYVALTSLLRKEKDVSKDDITPILKKAKWYQQGFDPSMHASFFIGREQQTYHFIHESFKEFLVSRYLIDSLRDYVDENKPIEEWLESTPLLRVVLATELISNYPNIATFASMYAYDKMQPNIHLAKLNALWEHEVEGVISGEVIPCLKDQEIVCSNRGDVALAGVYSNNLYALMALGSVHEITNGEWVSKQEQFCYMDAGTTADQMHKLMLLWKYSLAYDEQLWFAKQFRDERINETDRYGRCVRFYSLGAGIDSGQQDDKMFASPIIERMLIDQSMHDIEAFDTLRFYKGASHVADLNSIVNDERIQQFPLENKPLEKYLLMSLYNAIALMAATDTNQEGINLLNEVKKMCEDNFVEKILVIVDAIVNSL